MKFEVKNENGKFIEFVEFDNYKEAIKYCDNLGEFYSITLASENKFETVYVEEVEEVEINNEKSNEILMDVQIALNEIYGNSYKYLTIYKENETIGMRISNHTHNENNAMKGDGVVIDRWINVVIADVDLTEKKFSNSITDLRFTSENSVNEIVNKIQNLIGA